MGFISFMKYENDYTPGFNPVEINFSPYNIRLRLLWWDKFKTGHTDPNVPWVDI